MEIRDSFEIEPPPISPAEIEDALTTDVVVVGAGAAGKAAALSAAQAGARVIQIDKHVTYRYWLMDMTDAAGIETVMYQWPQPAGLIRPSNPMKNLRWVISTPTAPAACLTTAWH